MQPSACIAPSAVIDEEGFRSGVGMILMKEKLMDRKTCLLWAKRRNRNTWQFPQGGVYAHEKPEETLYREMYEELGLLPSDVQLLAHTQEWLRYRIPDIYQRTNARPLCVGQKQKWYLLKIVAEESHICLFKTPKPEFDAWRWVNYWYPLKHIIFFKRQVYKRALREFARFIDTA